MGKNGSRSFGSLYEGQWDFWNVKYMGPGNRGPFMPSWGLPSIDHGLLLKVYILEGCILVSVFLQIIVMLYLLGQMNCCNNPNILVTSNSRILSVFIITSMWQEVSQGLTLAHLVTMPALNPQTCPGRGGARVLNPAGVYRQAWKAHSAFPHFHWPEASQPYDPRPYGRWGNVVIGCVQEENQNNLLNTKHCLYHKWTIWMKWMNEKNSRENKDHP